MLVLDRRVGEGIEIEDVTVKVLRIGRNYVKLGIEADKCVRIVRCELVGKDASK